jgi:hypothetical protein
MRSGAERQGTTELKVQIKLAYDTSYPILVDGLSKVCQSTHVLPPIDANATGCRGPRTERGIC